MTIVGPYGGWPSPVAPADIAGGSIRFEVPVIVDGSSAYWVEVRPGEGGRYVLVRCDAQGRRTDVLPPACGVRSKVHEYGGAAFTVRDDVVWFVDADDQRVHRFDADGLLPLTQAARWRFGDLELDPARNRLLAVREDHMAAGEPVNTLVALHAGAPSEPVVLVSGWDFVSSPRVSPDGRRLAWLAWRHPSMPWDGCELWVAEIDANGRPAGARAVAGGPRESIFQPEWSPDGTLFFISDRSGWWNLWSFDGDEAVHVLPMDAEFGLPQWALGMRTYAFADSARIVCARAECGIWRLGVFDRERRRLTDVETPIEPGSAIAATPTHVVLVGGAPSRSRSVARVALDTGTTTELAREWSGVLAPEDTSEPRAIAFPTAGGERAHAFFYPPRNARRSGPDGERPPLIVVGHGGPTAAAERVLNPRLQFWTTRGFAVVDVNYRGSTGFGRAYRERLNGAWGVADVEDCVYAARWLADKGLVDGRRMVIRGSSAGGFTVLCALAFHAGVFAAGTSYFGVADPALLATDTHKFESRSLDTLIGPWPSAADTYRARSPFLAADRIDCPVLFFQGMEDAVVPPNQTAAMVEALTSRGVAAHVRYFEGEGHGFRRATTIVASLEIELAFYSEVLGIPLPDGASPLGQSAPGSDPGPRGTR